MNPLDRETTASGEFVSRIGREVFLVEEMGKAGLEGREGNHRAGKRKRPAGGRGSGVPAWGTSLSWKDVTPADSLSVLVGSGEGGEESLRFPYSDCIPSTGTMLVLREETVLKANTDLAVQHVQSRFQHFNH